MNPSRRRFFRTITPPLYGTVIGMLLALLLSGPASVNAQTLSPVDESKEAFDSAALARVRRRFDPEKALLYSAILPGAGQVYNKRYWKAPIVYGGFAFLGYYINEYNRGYRKYRGELFELLNTGAAPSGLPEASIRTVIDRYRRERDFFIILAGAWYALQIIDAHVDAHLKEFKVNPHLQVRVEPSLTQDVMLGRQTGFTVSIRF